MGTSDQRSIAESPVYQYELVPKCVCDKEFVLSERTRYEIPVRMLISITIKISNKDCEETYH
jgi:hypothetical protein